MESPPNPVNLAILNSSRIHPTILKFACLPPVTQPGEANKVKPSPTPQPYSKTTSQPPFQPPGESPVLTQQPLVAKAALLLAVSLTLGSLPQTSAQAQDTTGLKVATRPIEAATTFPTNGVYLYGETAQPNQLGRSYMVSEIRDGKIIGAFYMPNSSFDCFYGNVQRNRLALTVVETYSNQPYSYVLALESAGSVASIGSLPGVTALKPEGFHLINQITANDQRILGVCKAAYQTRLNK